MSSEPTVGAVLRTLLATDLVDSTRLVAQLGDERAFALFGRHDRMARDLLADHRGLEIDKTDGFLLLFERPLDAVAYALAYHQALSALGEEHATPLAARTGLHLGEVYLRENPAEDVARGAKPLEVEGLAKPMAARLMGLAQGGQTLLSRAAFDVARRASVGVELPVADVRWLAHGSYLLKGVDEPTEVFEVGGADCAPLAPPPDSEKARKMAGDQTIAGWRPAPDQDIPHRENWRLVDKLGEGGFGEVWLARHKKTGDRLVFKFCFEAERLRGLKREVTLFRLLKDALGDRPDITRVRDWNFDEQPYFLEIEYSSGGSLQDWAAAKGGIEEVPLAARLEIVAQAAEALAAAHSVGVLHKDLKPGNILITDLPGGPQAQLTDFGIGLLTDTSRLAELGITMAGMTELAATKGSTSGTPKYMAPELLAGRPATVQADIFALGVVLYQMLAGDLEQPLAPGWERNVADPLLRTDIAACVDGAPERRLASAGELALRLRTLEERRAKAEADREIQEAAERARRRRRILIPAVAALALFAVTMTIQARRVAREATRAEREAAAAREVSRFLVDMFDLAGSEQGRGESVTARELLDQGARRMQTAAGGDRLTQARLADTMGVVYLNLGLLDRAGELINGALATRRELLPGSHPDLAASLNSAGLLALRQRRFDDAEQLLRDALAIRERSLSSSDPDLAATLGHLALLFREQGRFDQARPYEQRLAALSSRDAPANGSERVAEVGETLTLHRDIPLPRDTVRLLGAGPAAGTALALGRQGVYLVDMDGAAPPVLAPLGAGEEILGPTGFNELAVRSGSQLVARNLFPRSGPVTERTLAEGFSRGEGVVLDPDGHTFARFDDTSLRLHSLSRQGQPLLARAALNGRPAQVVVSRRFAAWLDADRFVHALSLETGKEVLRAREWQLGRVNTLAIDDLSGRLAVGGWFDEVFIFDLENERLMSRHALPGETHSLLFLPDHPTLVVGKEGRLALFREQAEPVAEIAAPATRYTDLNWGAAGLLVREDAGQKLLTLSYRALALERLGAVAGVPIWGLAPSTDGSSLLIGTTDGRLHRHHLATDELESHAGHTQGLTFVTAMENWIVTASDDKTIALWDADTFRVIRSSQAHGFLVNYLHWEEATRLLWSASSDHTVKAWRLPDITEVETIAPGGGSKAALWVDSRRGLAIVGTWQGTWMRLRRDGADWKTVHDQPMRSAGAYSVAVHPRLDVALIVGVNPASVWLTDLTGNQTWELPTAGAALFWVSAVGEDGFLVVGTNTAIRYRVTRMADGLDVEFAGGLTTDLRTLFVSGTLADGSRVGAGNDIGEVFLLDSHSIPPSLGRIALR